MLRQCLNCTDQGRREGWVLRAASQQKPQKRSIRGGECCHSRKWRNLLSGETQRGPTLLSSSVSSPHLKQLSPHAQPTGEGFAGQGDEGSAFPNPDKTEGLALQRRLDRLTFPGSISTPCIFCPTKPSSPQVPAPFLCFPSSIYSLFGLKYLQMWLNMSMPQFPHQ